MLASICTKGLLFNMVSSYFRCKVYLFWANLVFGLQTTLAHNVDEGTWTLTVLHQQILSLYRLPIPTHPQSIFLYSVLNNWNNLAEMLEITWLIHIKYVIISSSIVSHCASNSCPFWTSNLCICMKTYPMVRQHRLRVGLLFSAILHYRPYIFFCQLLFEHMFSLP